MENGGTIKEENEMSRKYVLDNAKKYSISCIEIEKNRNTGNGLMKK